MDLMKLADLREGMLIQNGRELYQVSTVYENPETGGYFTAQLVYPVPGRTTVRNFPAEALMQFKPPTDGIVNRYDEAYGRKVR